MGNNIEADTGKLHDPRHSGGEAHVLIAGSDVDAALLALAMQLSSQRLPDAMRDDGIIKGISKLRLGELGRCPVGGLLRLVERLAEHHGGQIGKRNATTSTPVVLVALRPTRPTHRREQERGVVEGEVDFRLVQPTRLEAGVVGNNPSSPEEIGQHNQRACLDGLIEDQHGDRRPVRNLHGTDPVAGR